MLSTDYETKVTLEPPRISWMQYRPRQHSRSVKMIKNLLLSNITDEGMELKINSAFGTMNAEINITKFGKDPYDWF